jgi:hypothetical protein
LGGTKASPREPTTWKRADEAKLEVEMRNTPTGAFAIVTLG